jgi:DNA-binding beta-propeller fold protein YncE
MKGRRGWYLVAAGVAAVVLAIIVVVVVSPWSDDNEVPPIPGMAPEEEGERPVTDKVWGAVLEQHIPVDVEQADQPADIALVDGKMFLLDTGRGRLLELSTDGKEPRVLDKQVDPKLLMSIPMAVASHQGQLYVADSGQGQVLVVSPSGIVDRVIPLAKGSTADALPPRPLGIVVWDDGSFAVSDAANHRLLKYDADGKMLWTVGTGAPARGEAGFNVPSGLALDSAGNVYVVDILNSQVKKYSSDGAFVSAFGRAGDRAGEFSRPKAVAVDDQDNVYVSDGLQVAVQVFDQQGTYLGFIGRTDPADPNSGSLFSAPHGLKIVDGKLYVVDRYNGAFVFDLSTAQSGASQPETTETTGSD